MAESWHRHPRNTSGFRGEKAWDGALDQCRGECQEMVITALQIYSLGQSKLLSLFSRFFLAVFNLFALFPLSLPCCRLTVGTRGTRESPHSTAAHFGKAATGSQD